MADADSSSKAHTATRYLSQSDRATLKHGHSHSVHTREKTHACRTTKPSLSVMQPLRQATPLDRIAGGTNDLAAAEV